MALDPFTLAAIFGVGKSLLGGDRPTDLTAGMGNRDINYAKSQPFYEMLMGGGPMGASGWYNLGKTYAAKMGTALDQAGAYAKRPTADIMSEIGRSSSGADRIATQAAGRATSRGQASMVDLAELAASRARANMERRFGAQGLFGNRSGGTLAALMQGTAEPLLQAETAVNQAYGNAYAQNFGALLDKITGREFNRPSEMAGIASGFGQGLSLAGSQGGLLAQLLGTQAEPALVAPQFQTKPSALDTMSDIGMARLARNAGYGQGFGSGQDTLKLLQDILGPEKGLEAYSQWTQRG